MTLKKLGDFNSHTLRKKVFWVVINSNNRTDEISQKMLGKTNSGMTFIEGSLWHIG